MADPLVDGAADSRRLRLLCFAVFNWLGTLYLAFNPKAPRYSVDRLTVFGVAGMAVEGHAPPLAPRAGVHIPAGGHDAYWETLISS
ncbi:hypothetical protein EJB05_44403, partial [Eragrostis curvula]